MPTLALACLAFVGTHFLLSHPLRRPLVGVLGPGGFLGVYSLVALATFGWMIVAFRALPPQTPAYLASDGAWAAASVAMWFASILLVGSFIGNPALPGPGAATAAMQPPRGVFAITRHPMMWSFAIWALTHILLWPTPGNHAIATTILVLALVGSLLQDRKKAVLMGRDWQGWRMRTAWVPFSGQIAGRVPWRTAVPGIGVLAIGTIFWLGITWAHAPMGARMAAGVWRWL